MQAVADAYCFETLKAVCGGVLGAVIGVSHGDTSLEFHQELLGYNLLLTDEKAVFEDFKGLYGGRRQFRRVLLKHSPRLVGGFGELLGPTEIELVQVLNGETAKIYEGRLWGDLGYIHFCFDTHGIDLLRAKAKRHHRMFTVDGAKSFDMGHAARHFSYIEDPDGTRIEFVETHKVPILKRSGLFIDLKKRSPLKPLPRWLIKAMKLYRVKRDL